MHTYITEKIWALLQVALTESQVVTQQLDNGEEKVSLEEDAACKYLNGVREWTGS